MKVTRVDDTYAWSECDNPGNDCQNTVKFSYDGSETVCPACSTMYVCDGDSAKIVGYMTHKDDSDPGTPFTPD